MDPETTPEEYNKPLRVKNEMANPVIEEPRLSTKLKNLLSLHGISSTERLLTMTSHEFLSKWGLGWRAWIEVVDYKRLRSREDGKDYLELTKKRL